MSADNRYWAAIEGDDFGSELRSRVAAYYTSPITSQVLNRQVLAWRYAYGYGSDWFHGTSQILPSGQQGESAFLRVNIGASFARASVAAVTAPQIVWQPQAQEYSYKAIKAVDAAGALLDHEWTNSSIGRQSIVQAYDARYLGEGFIFTDWDPDGGYEYGADSSSLVRSGTFRYRNVWPWDVLRDPSKQAWDRLQWVCLRLPENKFDLAARLADRAAQAEAAGDAALAEALARAHERVLEAPPPPSNWFGFGLGPLGAPVAGSGTFGWKSDDVGTLVFLHKPTATLPFGRQATLLFDGTLIDDGPLKYGCWPLTRIEAAPFTGTPYGSTEYWDTLAIQEALDNLYSSGVTNYLTFTTQLVAYQRGTDPDILAAGSGLSLVAYEDKPPVGINLTAMPQGWFEMVRLLESKMEAILGQNPVTRGQSPGDRASGSLAALLSAMSMQQQAPFMREYENSLRMQAKIILKVARAEAKIPMKVGKSGHVRVPSLRWRNIEAADLQGVDEVYVDMGNAMQRSPSGRAQLAEMFMQYKILSDPKVIMQVVDNGRLEPETDPVEGQYTVAQGENEMISRGEVPIVSPADDDVSHCIQHTVTQLSLEARERPEVVRAFRLHVAQHYAQFYSVPPPLPPSDPRYLDALSELIEQDPLLHIRLPILLGKQPPPPDPNAAPPPGGPGGPPPGAAPPPPQGGTPPGPDGKAPGSSAGMPETPTNPATGRQWNESDGGGVPDPQG